MLARFQGFAWEATPEGLNAAARLKATKNALKLLKAQEADQEKAFLDHLIGAAEINGIEPGSAKNFTITLDGKKFATYNKQDRAGYEVKPTSFYVLRFAGKKGSDE
jgi:hypothetical protein